VCMRAHLSPKSHWIHGTTHRVFVCVCVCVCVMPFVVRMVGDWSLAIAIDPMQYRCDWDERASACTVDVAVAWCHHHCHAHPHCAHTHTIIPPHLGPHWDVAVRKRSSAFWDGLALADVDCLCAHFGYQPCPEWDPEKKTNQKKMRMQVLHWGREGRGTVGRHEGRD
jgi:hypothetical protein